jgi:hypothetical protein
LGVQLVGAGEEHELGFEGTLAEHVPDRQADARRIEDQLDPSAVLPPSLPQPLRIALVAPEKLDQNYKMMVEPGWTLLRFRNGNVLPEPFDTVAELLATLVAES